MIKKANLIINKFFKRSLNFDKIKDNNKEAIKQFINIKFNFIYIFFLLPYSYSIITRVYFFIILKDDPKEEVKREEIKEKKEIEKKIEEKSENEGNLFNVRENI